MSLCGSLVVLSVDAMTSKGAADQRQISFQVGPCWISTLFFRATGLFPSWLVSVDSSIFFPGHRKLTIFNATSEAQGVAETYIEKRFSLFIYSVCEKK